MISVWRSTVRKTDKHKHKLLKSVKGPTSEIKTFTHAMLNIFKWKCSDDRDYVVSHLLLPFKKKQFKMTIIIYESNISKLTLLIQLSISAISKSMSPHSASIMGVLQISP